MAPLKVLEVALNEVGYLEKKSAKSLDDKAANAGKNNFTKYARDLFPGLQGQPWCAMFVCWCMAQAYGKVLAESLLCGSFEAYTPTAANHYKREGRWWTTPQVGAQIFFRNSERICHTGLVYAVNNGKVYTVEGNTSTASGVVANGGGVCTKVYEATNSRIAGYGYPDYDGLVDGGRATVILRIGDKGAQVRALQQALNRNGAEMDVDGEYGPLTCGAVMAYQQAHGLLVDGEAGPLTLGSLGLA